MKSLLISFKKALRRFGFDVCRYNPRSHDDARVAEILKSYNIKVVLDVGANIGQYGEYLRNWVSYSHKIISFEPLSLAFAQLNEKIANDNHWTAHNYALGDYDGSSMINISENSQTSSILEMHANHFEDVENSVFTSREEIHVKSLDNIFNDLKIQENTLLKIDAQGFEKKILLGGAESLNKITLIQLEMSLKPLSQGETTFIELAQFMEISNFSLIALMPGYSKADGEMLQVDGIFRRNS